MKRLFSFILISAFFSLSLAQNQQDIERQMKGYINPEELVTLSESIPFSQAVEILSKMSEKFRGKPITSAVILNEPIGIEINKMPYSKALTIIVQYKNLIIEEKPDVIIIKPKVDEKSTLSADVYASYDSREVKISALFFEANISDINERGINWEYLLSKAGLSFGTKLRTFSSEEDKQSTTTTTTVTQVPPDWTISNKSDFNVGDFNGNVTAAFKFFETNNLGEIIAKPSVSVRNRMKGKIQIGSDISIKERDFAGNLIDKFYATGTIVDVTPYIYTEEGVNYVLLKLKVERSTGQPGAISTEIRKTMAETEILMLDGEETIIGGLFVTEQNIERRGIPFLKDLPWWFLGIKYLTGYDAVTTTKKEIIITIKTEILPSLSERIAKEKENIFKKSLIENRKSMSEIQKQINDSRENKEEEEDNNQ